MGGWGRAMDKIVGEEIKKVKAQDAKDPLHEFGNHQELRGLP